MKPIVPLLCLLSLAVACAGRPEKHRHHKVSARNEKYLDPNCNAEEWNKGFEARDKDTIAHREAIMAHLPVRKGDAIADVGAGTGALERQLSALVGPAGEVYAVDVAPAFIPFMKERFRREKLVNVAVVQGKLDETTLPAESVNLVLVVDTYHHFDHPEKMLADFRKILRNGGHLVVVDFKRGPGARPWVLDHVDKTMEEFVREITANGFEFLREEKIPFWESFQLTFRKK
jgi:ubiquinone/menaquinone biosynthesis C-methylase UbiE